MFNFFFVLITRIAANCFTKLQKDMVGRRSPTPPARVELNNEDPPNNNIVNLEILQTVRDLQEEIMNFKTEHERVLKTQEDLNEALLFKLHAIINEKKKRNVDKKTHPLIVLTRTEAIYLVNQSILATVLRVDIGRKENIKTS